MAYSLEQLRQYIRQHVDLDIDEMPNSLLDVWGRDASIKIQRTRKRWPFLEYSWTITTTPGQRDYVISSTFSPVADEIVSIVRNDRRLAYLGRDEAESYYLPYQNDTGEVSYFNVWNDTLRLYPTPTTTDTLFVRGYRKINDWVAEGAGAYPDFPEEFHDAIRLYMLAMAYLQQEDVEMASQFMGAFSAEMDLLKRQYGDAPGAYPLVIGGGPSPYRRNAGNYGRLRFPFD